MIPLHTEADAVAATEEVRWHLEHGGIIAYPTETVYGFGCMLSAPALETLTQMKGRDAESAFLLLAAAPLRLRGLQWNAAAYALASRFWPGPLTLALAADPLVYEWPVLSAQQTVAVRQTSRAPLHVLLAGLGVPITSTSANAHGVPAATSAQRVEAALRDLGARDVLVLDGGPTAATAPSTIVDCSGEVPRMVREGAVPMATLRAALVPGGFSIDA